MDWFTFALILITLIAVKYHKQLAALIQHRIDTLRCMAKLDGPPAWPIVGTAPYLELGREEFALQVRGWSEKYSRKTGMMVIWLGPVPLVTLTKPETVEVIYSSSQVAVKAPVYNIMRAFLGDGLITSHGAKWKARRRMLTPAFHLTILEEFLQIYNQQSDRLVERLEKKFIDASTTETFDLYPYIRACALDVICATSMGTPVNAQDEAANFYSQAVETMNALAYRHMRSPWLWPDIIWRNTAAGKKYNEVTTTVTGFTRNLIRKRRVELQRQAAEKGCTMNELRNGRKAIPAIDILLMMNDDNKLSEDDIREEIDTLASAGHETTAAAVTWSLFFLGHHTDCQKKVHEEIVDTIGDESREITSDDIKKMDYLERCLKESLRLAGPVASHARILVEDTKVGNVILPSGTQVLLAPAMVHRDPDHWPNPETFDPNRFTVEETSKRHHFAYVPFAAGPRNCLGQKFAMMEAKTILTKVLHKYCIESMQAIEKTIGLPELVFKPLNGFPVRFHKR